MRTSCARRAVSTAWAAVALALASAGPALAAPPQCTTPPPQTVIEGLQLTLSGLQYCSDSDLGDVLTVAVGPASHGATGAMGDMFGYIPEPGYTGPDEFTLTASDGTFSSDPVTVTIIVAPNQPPSCPATRSFHVAPDTPAPFDPREGCLDDAGPLNPEIVVAPVHGTIGQPGPFPGYVYTPETGYQGPDTFTVALKDHLGVSDQVVVEVTISPNHAPTCATPVTRQVAVGGQLTLDLRNTCSDPDGDPMTAEAIALPTHGQVGPGVPPTYLYVPDPGYTGTDRIVYRARDSLGAASNEAVIDLVIGDPPVQQQGQTQTQAGSQSQPSDQTPPSFDLARAGAQKLAAIRRSGLKLRLACDEAGTTATIELSLAKRVARRFGVPRVIGRATKTLVAGDNAVVVRLTRRAKRRLASAKRLTIVVLVTGRDNAGNTAGDTLRLPLRR